MTRHVDLLARHRAVLPNWIALFYEEPIALVDGQGRHVIDAEGNHYLDFFGGILTTSIGYNLPEIVEVAQRQMGKMVHTSTLYLIESQIELAERIASLSGIKDAKVFFANSGTEANEAALLFSCILRQSNQVIALRNGYHGRSFTAMGVTGIRSWSASGLNPLDVSYVHGGYRYRSPFSDLDDEAFVAAVADDLRDVLETNTSGDVAALIVEPVQGVGGFAVPPDGLFGAMHEITEPLGITFISDEVQTGWGRTGLAYWGIAHHGVVPDAMTFAKGLANGLPIGGVVARADLVDSITVNSISTFGGNPLVTAVALATLDYIESHNLAFNAEHRGRELLEGLSIMERDYEEVGEVRGKGLMVAIEYVEPGGKDPAPRLTSRVLEECRQRGLLVGKGGRHGNCLRIAPPMSVTKEEVATAVGILLEATSAAIGHALVVR
ncbi:MAG TPA: aspartate aminotransferase family protein [Acidimicrobiales bacterium]|nr:aspartate aminotransferase family protein [Acidimicrobiales bacterium]